MRINKYLAKSQVASRREAENLVLEGRVKVNGNIVTSLSTTVDENSDIVEFDGKIVKPIEKKYYLKINKPVGYTCSNKSQFNEKIIFDLIDLDVKLFTIGRLDKDSRGLVLITNDGDIYNKVIHPRSSIDKVYNVILDKNISVNDLNRLISGIDIDGYVTKPAKLIKYRKNRVTLSISEGKNRQIRKMFEKVGYKVLDLHRQSIGNIEIGELESGEYRNLTKEELIYLESLG